MLGELFVLGFRGTALPAWLRAFADELGLGGVLLFDYDVATRRFGRNVESPAQVRELCAQVHALPGRPLVFVDQEGGRVRRLKEDRGFAPLPSARAFAALPREERRALLRRAFAELRDLGIDYDLAPVVDLDTNLANPNIGAVERSFSADPRVVEENALLCAEAAREVGLGLCLKHYPGLGGARVDSHLSVTDLGDAVDAAQLDLFARLVGQLPGRAILLSHGIVRGWDAERPVSISLPVVSALRRRVGDALLLTDDLQMEGLRALCPDLAAACREAARAGADLLLVGNNLRDESEACAEAARALARAAESDTGLRRAVEAARERVRAAKRAAAG